MSGYTYADGDLLEIPNSYQYTTYTGQSFVANWSASRKQVIDSLPDATREVGSCTSSEKTTVLLKSIINDLQTENTQTELLSYWLQRLVKKFEVSKRLYTEYNDTPPHYPSAGSSYKTVELYLLFAECLLLHPDTPHDTRLLNCLLKLCDTLCSVKDDFQHQAAARLAWVLESEQQLVQQLRKRIGL